MNIRIVEVKKNVGTGKEKVKIISNNKISDADIKIIEEMKLDEVRHYAKIKQWVVYVMED